MCGGVGLLLGACICSFQFISGLLYKRILISFEIQIESDLSEVQVWLHKCPHTEPYWLKEVAVNRAAKS